MPTSANIKYAWYPRNGSLEFRLVDAVRVQEGEWADVHARHDASPYYASKELPGLGWAWVDELEDSYLEAVPILFGQYEGETKSQES